MNAALNELCNDLAEYDGNRLRVVLDAVETEARSNPHAAAFWAAVCWLCEQPRSPVEKLTAIAELLSLPRGFVHIPSMAEFCGWRDA